MIVFFITKKHFHTHFGNVNVSKLHTLMQTPNGQPQYPLLPKIIIPITHILTYIFIHNRKEKSPCAPLNYTIFFSIL